MSYSKEKSFTNANGFYLYTESLKDAPQILEIHRSIVYIVTVNRHAK